MENDMPQAAITNRSPHSPPYKRHRPEQTLLYQIIERYYPEFREVMAVHDCMDAGGRATHGAVAEGKALCPCMCNRNLPITSNADVWNTDSCGCNARAVVMNIWLRTVAPKVGALGERRGFCPSCGARRMAEADVTPARRGKGNPSQSKEDKTPEQCHQP